MRIWSGLQEVAIICGMIPRGSTLVLSQGRLRTSVEGTVEHARHNIRKPRKN